MGFFVRLKDRKNGSTVGPDGMSGREMENSGEIPLKSWVLSWNKWKRG